MQIIRTSKLLGAAIARHRKKQGLTQSALAAKVNARQVTISDLENGKGGTRIEIMFGILAVLNLDIVLQNRDVPQKSISDIF